MRQPWNLTILRITGNGWEVVDRVTAAHKVVAYNAANKSAAANGPTGDCVVINSHAFARITQRVEDADTSAHRQL